MYPKNFKKPSTITLTFSECGENHIGMEKIGEKSPEGYTLDELTRITNLLISHDVEYKLKCLNELLPATTSRVENVDKAYVLIIRGGVNFLLDKHLGKGVMSADDLLEEIGEYSVDTKYYDTRRKKVLNKRARYNNMFVDGISQSPDIENKKGTIHDIAKTDVLKELLASLRNTIQDDELFVVEGNYYYDVKKTYIGQHGDTERKKVVGVRLGESFNLGFQWFYNSTGISEMFVEKLFHGDMYIFSDKAVGCDWESPSKHTLRHCAGDDGYISRLSKKKSI